MAGEPDAGDLQCGDGKSKSQRKREHHEIKALGARLLTLAPESLARLNLDDAVRDAVASARRLQRGALQRQLRHLANLLAASAEPAALRATLDRLDTASHGEIRVRQRLERWRDALIAGDGAVLDEIAERNPDYDRGLVRRLAQAARREREGQHPPRSARRLYAYLRDVCAAAAETR